MPFPAAPPPDSPKETVRPAGGGGGRQEHHRAFVPGSLSNPPKASFQYICMKWFHPRVSSSLSPSPPRPPRVLAGLAWLSVLTGPWTNTRPPLMMSHLPGRILLFLHPGHHESYIFFSPSTMMLKSLHSMGSHWGVFSRRGCGGICDLKAALVTREGQGRRRGGPLGQQTRHPNLGWGEGGRGVGGPWADPRATQKVESESQRGKA